MIRHPIHSTSTIRTIKIFLAVKSLPIRLPRSPDPMKRSTFSLCAVPTVDTTSRATRLRVDAPSVIGRSDPLDVAKKVDRLRSCPTW